MGALKIVFLKCTSSSLRASCDKFSSGFVASLVFNRIGIGAPPYLSGPE